MDEHCISKLHSFAGIFVGTRTISRVGSSKLKLYESMQDMSI